MLHNHAGERLFKPLCKLKQIENKSVSEYKNGWSKCEEYSKNENKNY